MNLTTQFHLVPSSEWMELSAVTAVCLHGMNTDYFICYTSPSTFMLQKAHNTKCTLNFQSNLLWSTSFLLTYREWCQICMKSQNAVVHTSRGQIAMETKFCTVLCSTCESLVWNLLHGTLLVPRLLRWPLDIQFVCLWYKEPWTWLLHCLEVSVHIMHL